MLIFLIYKMMVLNEINDPNLISTEQRFIIIVANADLSPGATIEINGVSTSVVVFRDQVNAALSSGTYSAYTLGQPTISGDQQLTSFKISFALSAIEDGGLIPTATGCVKHNNPGANGEYRNGALTIQALNADSFNIDSSTGAASLAGGGLLWESTIFWHKDNNCYE